MRKQIKIVFFIILISINYSALGVIAYPYPAQITQPDGTKITVILKGDEHVKWAQTVDGYSIMRNSNGIYEYAIHDAKYDMVPSGIRVRNQSERSSSDNQFLGKTKKGLTYSRSQIGMLKSISKMHEKGAQKVFPTTGSRKLVCILIGFTDKAFTKTQADFYNLFNQVGYTAGGATGSVKDFYAENSYNQLDLTVTVAGPFTAANNLAYYGANDAYGNDIRPRELVTEAVNLADPTVNFANFDNDGDGTVDGIYVIYAGYGEEAGGGADCIWAHAWNITPVVKDGVTISSYSCSAELSGNSGSALTGIGVICHEFGHVMGALDFYDTDYGTNGQYDGTGDWDIMAEGSWNNNGITPAQHNPYDKITAYGWATPTVLASGTNITLTNAEQNSNSFYRINTATTNEYFLIEDRQQHKFDSYIPGHGMIIYHVDENYISTAGNLINAGSHQGMYPVCASAAGNPPATYGTINSDGCSFPGSAGKTSFTDATTPNSLSWAGLPSSKYITNITENLSAKTVSFSLVINSSPIAVTGTATITSTTSATLNAQVDANGLSTTVTFEYGTTTSYGSTINGTPNIVSGTAFTGITAALTGLTTNTTYNYRVKAVNSGGTTYGSNMTFTLIVLNLPVTENFDAATMPTGWTTQNTGTGITERWSISNSSSAGGSPYELMCDFMQLNPAPGVTRVITPAINTTGISGITLSFKHFFDDYGAGATIRIQSSKDLVNWTNETWSSPSGSGNIGPATVNTTIANNLNSTTTYIAFVIDGDLYQFDNWYIDDVSLAIACTSPTTQASAFTSSAITTSSMTAGWTRGNGSSVLVVARQGSTVNSDPVAGTTYTANSAFGSGTQIGTGNYVVYSGTGTTVNVTGLSPGTGYYYAIYEYSASKCYKIPALTGNATTTGTGYCTANLGGSGSCPGDITALSITSTTLNNTTHNNCSTANGSTYGLYTPVGNNTCTLVPGTAYTFNITTTNSDIVSLWIDYNQNGSFEVTEWTQVSTSTQAGISASVSFTVPLAASTGQTGLRVRSRLYGNQNGATDACLTFGSGITEDYTINIGSGCTPPTVQATAFTSTAITANSMTAGWTRGNGSSVLVVARQGSTVNSDPVAGTTYTANAVFGSGTAIGSGNYVVYNGTGTSVNVTGLSPVTGYYYAIYEYNSGTICYKVPALTGNATTTACTSPATPTVGTITQPSCAVPTGSVVLTNLPATGTWTLTRTPGGITTTGTGTSTTVTGMPAGTFTFTVTNASGCISAASANVVITASPSAPATPTVGTITQPTCAVATGSVVLTNLPATGTWTLTRTPGGTTTTGAGTSTTVSGIPPGTYTFTVTNASGCISASSANVVIIASPSSPATPTVGTITQPTCTFATGSVVLNSLPATGSWTLTRTPGGTTTSGTGTSTTVSGIPPGTYTYTVTNASTCISLSSAEVIINSQPSTPTAPIVGTITQPTCTTATGSVDLNYLPSTGTWTLTVTPGGTSTTGTGTNTTITGLTAGTYIYTVTNASGCTSSASVNIVINTQPATPSAPAVGTTTQPTCTVATGGVVLSGLPSSGSWTLTRTPGGTTTTGTGTSSTISGLASGTYTYKVTNAQGCSSVASANVVISAQPQTPTAPITGTIVQPKWTVATGGVILTGLPATGTWTLTRTPGGTTTTGTGTSSSVSGLAAGTYTYTVTNASGCMSIVSAPAVIYTQPPAPSGLTASSCNNLVTLNWKKITDPSFRLYRIYGGTTTNPTTKIDSITSSISDTSKAISGLTKGQTYYFQITAVDIGGSESNTSNQPNAKVKTGVIPKIRVKWGTVLTCSNLGDSIKNYQWYKDGSAISKASGQYYVTNKKAGPYYVETIDLNGCVNTSNTLTISGTKSLSVYPNPASVSFALKLNDVSDARAEVSILNSAGIKVMEFQVENVNDQILKEIPVRQLKEGTYIVQVLLDHKDLYSTKIVVIK